MLSAQSTDKQVDEALPELFGHFQTAQAVAEAPAEEIEQYIRSVGLYKNKAKNIKKCCEQIVSEYGGKVPDKLDEVLKLAGVGRKTATLFLADAYGIPGVTVDTHVFRISRRLGWAEGKKSAAGGAGADEGASEGALEPDKFSAYLSGTGNLYLPGRHGVRIAGAGMV